MGFYMQQRDSSFRILRQDFDKALAAIKGLAGKETILSSAGGPHFSWVDTADFLRADSLEEALDAWRWCLEVEGNEGDAFDIRFEGEKLGDDEQLFQAIAPFVQKGSFIEMSGDDSTIWRWVFDGKTVQDKTAQISFD